MALDSTHPLYSKFIADWALLRDLHSGERTVKARGEAYLPSTSGMRADGMKAGEEGRAAYDAYKTRALFPDYVKEAVEAYIGLLHSKPPTIELPSQLEDLRINATTTGESLELLLRRINQQQLITGRLGLMLDLPESPNPQNPLPYIALYEAESIRNWDDAEIEEGRTRLNMVVLDESGFFRDTGEFDWTQRTKYRVLLLGELRENEKEDTGARYSQGVFQVDGAGTPIFVESDMMEPSLRGKALERIPFAFINASDIVSMPDEVPLIGLAQLSLAIYRGDADWRQNLFMQSQDTLVLLGDRKRPVSEIEGDEAPLRTGAGSYIEMEMGSEAKYVGVESEGLAEQRTGLENDHKRAESRAAKLIDASQGDKESGEALKTRVAAQTATLNQIAQAGAAGLEAILKHAAEWMGANPDEVIVTPNLEFSDYSMTGKELVDLMTARTMGAPLSLESVHALMVERGMTDKEFGAEKELVEQEFRDMPNLGTPAGGNEPNPDDDLNA